MAGRWQRWFGAGFRFPALNSVAGLVSAVILSSSCGPKFYGKMADRETKGILGRKTGGVPNVDNRSLDISKADPISLEELSINTKTAEYLAEVAEQERGARILSLADALGIAIKHNRTYLTQKEAIYLQALELTLTRHELAPIFTGTGGWEFATDSLDGDPPPLPDPVPEPEPAMEADAAAEGADAAAVADAGDMAAEMMADAGDADAADVEVAADMVERQMDGLISTQTYAADYNIGFSMLQRTGARLAADFTSDFLRFLAGDPSINNSRLAVTLVQPLLRGGGYAVTMETLTQADRDLLYALRDFANFRREFVVEIVSRFYGLLQARDTVNNNWIGYQGFKASVERQEALAEEDRVTQAELGRLRQALLQSEVQWIGAVRDYQTQLDELKIELGLSIDEKIVLDESELADLRIINPKISRTQSVTVALDSRPDLESSRNRVEDAERRIEVAKVELQAGVDVVASYDAISDPGEVTPRLNFDRRRWSAGFDVDLPFDRKAERNFYRTTLIALEQAKRDEELSYDLVKQEVYNGWRALEQARRNFDIGELSVQLAQRRLEEQELRADIGQGDALDLVDAQRDLVDSLNGRTSALVEHTLARLRLWSDMGILFISEDGSWVRMLEEEGQ